LYGKVDVIRLTREFLVFRYRIVATSSIPFTAISAPEQTSNFTHDVVTATRGTIAR
jgi:hypothetical protein